MNDFIFMAGMHRQFDFSERNVAKPYDNFLMIRKWRKSKPCCPQDNRKTELILMARWRPRIECKKNEMASRSIAFQRDHLNNIHQAALRSWVALPWRQSDR
jgi:hypothetical protein